MTNIEIKSKRVTLTHTKKNIYSNFGDLIIAAGHSARDTYRMLFERGIAMRAKPFAVGVRCEHPQQVINRSQYGKSQPPDNQPAADYRLVHNINTKRSTYSFCMCPGGIIVCSSAENHKIAVNGMSNFKRNSLFANSALVVKVNVEDFESNHPLSGLYFQEKWEEKAFLAANKSLRAPAQRITDFLKNQESSDLPDTSYSPALTPANLNNLLPGFVKESLHLSLTEFEKKIPGFVSHQAILVGTETKTSAPLQILRNNNFASVSADNLYPVGEGAGHAGGIVSAALDGMSAALKIVEKYK